jgi:hypothetical protein
MYERRLNRRRRRGVIVLLVAVSLVAVLAILALSLDAGRLVDARRHAKAAADAAARGAAIEMLEMESLARTDITLSTIRQSAFDLAEANGYANDGTNSVVHVNLPPASGPHAGKHGFIEIIVEARLPRGFSRMFGSEPLTVVGRSVAAGTLVPSKGSVLVLNSKKKNALALGKGSSSLFVNGDVAVNSIGKKPLTIKRDAQITAENVLLAGSVSNKEMKSIEKGLRGELHMRVPPADDPFASLPVPPIPATTRNLSAAKKMVNGVETYNLQPGRYKDTLKFEKDMVVTMAPGEYYLDNVGLELKGNATLHGQGVTIYSAGKNELKFQSQGEVRLTPPISGTYAGVTIFKDRVAKSKITFKKDGNTDIEGAIYAPNSLVRFNNSTSDLGDEDDDSPWDDLDADLDDAPSGDEISSSGSMGASIVAGMLKIDKHSIVRIRGAHLNLRRPLFGLVE